MPSLLRDNERVRLKIGRGSPNTVSPLLNHWFASLGARLSGSAASPVPEGPSEALADALPPSVRHAARALWQAANREAEEAQRAQFEVERQSLQSREAALAEHESALRLREAAFEETRETLSIALASAQQARETAEQQVSQTAREAVRLHKALEVQLQQLRSQLAGASARAEHASAQYVQTLAARDQDLRQAEQRHGAEHKRMQAEIDRARQSAKVLEAELIKARQRLQKDEEAAAMKL